MMIHAYQEIYLNNAQSALGDAFDYAINTCGINGNDFVNGWKMVNQITLPEKVALKLSEIL